MNVRTHLIICATITVLVTLVAPPAFAVIDLPRGTNPVFRWDPASGPLYGYGVYAYCNGDERVILGFAFENTTRIYPQFCDTLVIRVAAWGSGSGGAEGPLSEPSETIRFVGEEDAGSPGTVRDTGAIPFDWVGRAPTRRWTSTATGPATSWSRTPRRASSRSWGWRATRS